MSEPTTAAGRQLLEYAQGLPNLFLTQAWGEGILAIEAEARAAALDGQRRRLVQAHIYISNGDLLAAGREIGAAIDALREPKL